MASEARSRKRCVKAIPIPEFRDVILDHYRHNRSKTTYLRIKQVLNSVIYLIGEHDTSGLNQDFFARFLDSRPAGEAPANTYNLLCQLHAICSFAKSKDWIAETPSLAQAVSGNSELDRRDWRDFYPDKYERRDRDLDKGQVIAILDDLKHDSSDWLVHRLFVLCSSLVYTDLLRVEALRLKIYEYKQEHALIRVESRVRASKETKRYSKRIELPVPPEFSKILDDWIPLSGPIYLFPRLDRDGPWITADKRHGANRGGRSRLIIAGQAAGIDDLTFRDLRRFFLLESARAGIVSGIIKLPRGRARRPDASPFVPGPDDLRTKPISIASLKAAVMALYRPNQRTCLRMTRVVFGVIEGMGLEDSSGMGSPGFVDRFIKAAGIIDPESSSGRHFTKWLHTICGKVMEIGHLNADPFLGRPGFANIARSRIPGRPAKPPRQNKGRINAVEMTAKPPRVCPVELRGEGLPVLVHGHYETPRLSGIAYALLAFAVERFHEGQVCLARELKARTSSTSDRPIQSLTMKLKEPGFEPLARVIKWDAKKGGTLSIIDPGPIS